MVRAQRPVPSEQVARRLVLLLQRLGRLHARELAELVFAQDPNLPGLLGVELFGLPEFLAAIDRAEPRVADDKHRRLRVEVFGSRAAELRHERERVLAAERTQFSSEDDKVSPERL